MQVIPAQIVSVNFDLNEVRVLTEDGEQIRFTGSSPNKDEPSFKPGENVFLVRYKIGIFFVRSTDHIEVGKKIIDDQIGVAIARNQCAGCKGPIGMSQTGLCPGCTFRQAMNPVAETEPIGIKVSIMTEEQVAAKFGITVEQLRETFEKLRKDQN